MTIKPILTIGMLILLSFLLESCQPDGISCAEDQEFCTLIDNQDFEATGQIINDFLTELPKNAHDQNLEKLQDWLSCASCVAEVSILCNSCIKTLPPMSELSVDFVSNGQTTMMIMDIVMDESLRFANYH